ncbi:MAG: four helix bundle protein [Phototrophicaceae bacterium]
MQDYKKLQIWKRSHQLVLQIYRTTADFPSNEKYGLISQIQRCAVSIPSNIAEGSGRNTNADFARFLHIAMGSAAELDYQLLLSHDLGFLQSEIYDGLSDELTQIRKMLNSFTQSLKTD